MWFLKGLLLLLSLAVMSRIDKIKLGLSIGVKSLATVSLMLISALLSAIPFFLIWLILSIPFIYLAVIFVIIFLLTLSVRSDLIKIWLDLEEQEGSIRNPWA